MARFDASEFESISPGTATFKEHILMLMLHVTRCMAASRLGPFVALLALSGCDSGTPSATLPATPPPTVVPVVGAGSVTFDTVDRAGIAAPEFIAWQDGDGPWQSLPLTLHHTLNITDPAGRFSIAVGDATTPPRNFDVDPSASGITTDSSGYIVHMTRAEATNLSLPLGIPPTQLYDISVRVTTGADYARLGFVSAFKDDVPSNTNDQDFFHLGVNLIPGAPYTIFAAEGILADLTPRAQTRYRRRTEAAPTLSGPIYFTPINYKLITLPGPDLSCLALFGLDPRVNVTGVPANKHVFFSAGLMTMQGVFPADYSTYGFDVISTGATISRALSTLGYSGSIVSDVFQTFTISTSDASGAPLSFQTTYAGCGDINLTFPPTSVVVTTPTAAPSSLPAYPRIRVPFTTLPAGTVHEIYLGRGLPIISPTQKFDWRVFASTGWFGDEGKAVTWDFPDFTALTGWSDALWKTWALTAPVGVGVGMKAVACDTASNGVSFLLGRAMPAGCNISISPIGNFVTLP